MGVLLLVRHGQASLGTVDYDALSDLGHEQARRTARRLAESGLPISSLHAGSLKRQRDTVAAIAAALGRPLAAVGRDPRLDEYDPADILAPHPSALRFADATDAAARARVSAVLHEALATWIVAGKGSYAESHDAFQTRLRNAIGELAAQPGTTLAVTSGGVVGAFCAYALGLPAERWPALARLTVNCGITKLITGESGTNVVSFNDFAHLEADRSLVTYH